MTNAEKRFVDLYRAHRHEDQQAFYANRAGEFEAAHEQAIGITAWLMAGSSIVAALTVIAVSNAAVFGIALSILAVALPTLSSALAAYDRLYAFDQQAKLYHDAAAALQLARANAPDVGDPASFGADGPTLSAYINEVEGIFRREQGQWGQLISDLQPGAPAPVAEKPAKQGAPP